MHEWRDHDLLKRAPMSLPRLARRQRGGSWPSSSSSRNGVGRPARPATSTPAASGRDRPPAGRPRPRRRGRLPARPQVTAEHVYGRNAVREAIRGPRQVLEVWATERALAAEPWLRDEQGLRLHVKPERALTDEVGTRDHQGIVARVAPYRYADVRARRRGEPAARLFDQVTDPHNLGAVARSARSGRNRRDRPESRLRAGDAGRGACFGRCRRASSDRGRAEPRALPERRERARPLGLGGGLRRRHTAVEGGLDGGVAFVLGAEGRGLRPLVRRACDGIVSIPLGGQIESLNVSVAAAVLLYEVRRRRSA